MTATHRAERQLSSNGREGAVTDIGLDSYATAWRYLGVYTDCGGSGGWGSGSWSSWWSGDDDDDGSYGDCSGGTRKLMWAAYKNTEYRGDEIGEYEFYVDGQWDNATCVGENCTRMDCHDPWDSGWELLGVYKETVDFGNDMFFEQLFKHQGYCLWDGDKEDTDDDDGSGNSNSQDYSGWGSSDYKFMQSMRLELPSGCTQVGDLTYGSESNYYIAIKPLQEGDMTLGVYLDSSCLEEAELSFSDYQNYAASYLTATGSSGAFDTWNANMDSYKVCQPCRAYNREQMYQSNWEHRHLTEYYDGQGDYELNNYNCYDDAHYQNCNQCYKFETHSDMEAASASDLKAASAQGTILLIKYGGTWYGNGTVGNATESAEEAESASYGNGWTAGWSAAMASFTNSSNYSVSTQSASSYGDSAGVSYSAAGGVSLLLCGVALVGAFRKATRRRIALASEGSTPSATSPPLV